MSVTKRMARREKGAVARGEVVGLKHDPQKKPDARKKPVPRPKPGAQVDPAVAARLDAFCDQLWLRDGLAQASLAAYRQDLGEAFRQVVCPRN